MAGREPAASQMVRDTAATGAGPVVATIYRRMKRYGIVPPNLM